MGAIKCLTINGAFFLRDFGKTGFYRMLEEAMWNQGMVGWEVGGLFIGLVGPNFREKVNYLKLSWRIVIGTC